jgi:hypothetical protein
MAERRVILRVKVEDDLAIKVIAEADRHSIPKLSADRDAAEIWGLASSF